MRTAEKFVIGGAVVTLAILAGVLTIGQPEDRKRKNLGSGDDQSDEGQGFNARLNLGLAFPPEHTRWHYGPGDGPLPTNWERHRLSYPRRPGDVHQKCGVTPMNHPAFPRRERIWYYHTPADEDL
jgi:hypothetical protein